MKKLFVLILTLFLISCGGERNESTNEFGTNVEQTNQTQVDNRPEDQREFENCILEHGDKVTERYLYIAFIKKYPQSKFLLQAKKAVIEIEKSFQDNYKALIKSLNEEPDFSAKKILCMTFIDDNFRNSAHFISLVRKKLDLLQAEHFRKNSPLEISEMNVDNNEIGVPQIRISLKNHSSVPIDAFTIHVYCFNNFGERVTGYFGKPFFVGIAQYSGRGNDSYIPADGENFHPEFWTLNGFDNTTKVKIIIQRIHFTNGTTWIRR
jgi:hypothetical protein